MMESKDGGRAEIQLTHTLTEMLYCFKKLWSLQPHTHTTEKAITETAMC